MSRLIGTTITVLLFAASAAQAQQTYVPEELEPWREWVLDGKDYRRCPFYFNSGANNEQNFVCVWPGTLELDVSARGARFVQSWTVVAKDAWLPLPGDAAYWPDGVTANGAVITVVEHDGRPSVKLSPGRYRLAGRFEWDQRPGMLRVPPESGLVALTVDGERIARPEIERDGVFLGEPERQVAARDAVSVDVYRLVADDVPTRLITRIDIDVSGSVREELFGPVLPEGFTPLSLASVLPTRLEADGQLRVQVRPGRWQLTLSARAAEVLNRVSLSAGDSNLPATEIWSYRANDRLRVTAPEGLPPVDPQRVQVPDGWEQLPAFRISRGEALDIVERSRGMAAAENSLALNRRMWLDFDGTGFTVRDNVRGSMRSGWRLDMQPPYALESATERGENLLITRGDDDGETGIEVREAQPDLETIGRSETRGAMPATGWDVRFNDVETMLYLPPGHKLVAAPGVDTANGSWVGQWQLFDFFLVLIITIAAWKLFGAVSGTIALFALTLSVHEVGAPAWLWLNLLVAVALLRVAPAGRLRTTVRTYMGLSALTLVLVLVPFVGDQLRVAIYPQLEPQWNLWQYGRAGVAAPQETLDFARPASAPAVTDEAVSAKRELAPRAQALEEIAVSGSKPDSSNLARYAPNAIVQAGPGIPKWQWNAYRLSYGGPVDAGQTMRLVILPRWLVTGLRFVEVGLLLLFAAVFAAEILKRRFMLPGGLSIGRSASASLGALLLAVALTVSPDARAEIPSVEILKELEQRLLEPPDCAPRCAEIVSATVNADTDTVGMRLTINAIEEVAVPLPGSARGWRPDAVVVDGGAAVQVLRGRDQSFWLRVPAGRHDVTLRGAAAAVDSLEIPFPTPPRVITASGDGWLIAGIRDRRLVSGSLQLTRLRADGDADGAPRWEASRFPAFAQVTRRVELGLDWRVTTTVQRIAPALGALTLSIPLIDGESVVTADMTVEDGALLVSMNPTQRVVSWQSNLERRSPLELATPAGAAWTEIWQVGVGSVWHAAFSGVPESESGLTGDGVRTAEFHPRGGESLTIQARRPEAAEGTTLAFDTVGLDVEQGMRSRSVSLSLAYRSTRGAQHVIRLPDAAEVTNVSIDGRSEPLRAENGELTLPILPGEHNANIDWREDVHAASRLHTPVVDLGAQSSNLSLTLKLPQNRWLLATQGPRLGPAVLYWSELAVLVLFALLLGRIEWTPLKARHWLLLGLGFSTFNWPVLALVAVWLLAVGARDKWRFEGPWWRYNLLQTGVIVLTVIALTAIVSSLPVGLLGTPDMHVTGNNSGGNTLTWFADRSDGATPIASAFSVPMWIYKALILAWALWLSFALLKWLPWTWQCFARDGFFRSRDGDRVRETAGGAN